MDFECYAHVSRFTSCDKFTALVGVLQPEETMLVWGRVGYGKSLYLPLSFAVNLKLLLKNRLTLKIKVIQRVFFSGVLPLLSLPSASSSHWRWLPSISPGGRPAVHLFASSGFPAPAPSPLPSHPRLPPSISACRRLSCASYAMSLHYCFL